MSAKQKKIARIVCIILIAMFLVPTIIAAFVR